MGKAMKHRGPDAQGSYHHNFGDHHISFSHNRLKIIDLSERSAQPFRYLNRYALVYNGEIYNYTELRHQLAAKGFSFNSDGDTEVLAAAYACWGPECLDKLDGMFSFAIWDEQEGILFCARDRFGEKPFFYRYDGGQFMFASEIRGLLAAGVTAEADPAMIYNFLTLGHTRMALRPERTFFKYIFQLPPSHQLSYIPTRNKLRIEKYWDLDKETVVDMPETQALQRFEELLHYAVNSRMRSDVETGTSLSGGLDSSSIVALAAGYPSSQYKRHAFSAVFPGFEKDESDRIRKLVAGYNLNWHEVRPTAEQFRNTMEKLLQVQEEPFVSASVMAQYMVYQAAAEKGVRVLLDGQGADEVLAGYTKYTHWYLQERIHLQGWKATQKEAISYRVNQFLPHWNFRNRLAAKFPGIAQSQLLKKARKAQKQHHRYISKELTYFYEPDSLFKPYVEKLNDIQYHDLMMMGLEELLHYADRNSMAHSVEVRLPFLYHELVQFVLSLPPHYRFRNGYTKWILRHTMKHKLPEDICWQKGKIGFEPPQQQWMTENKDMVMEAREIFLKKGWFKPEIMSQPIQPAAAHDAANIDFRTLSAAAWLKAFQF